MAKIYYFSGTGNSYQVAKKLSQKIDKCELIKITYETNNLHGDDDLMGVVFPVYYFGLPKVVEDFLISFDYKNEGFLFIIATRGIPFAGGVRNQLLTILGDRISYFQYVTMGDNFNIDFWNSSSNKTKKVRNRRCDALIGDIAESINNRVTKKRFVLIDFMWFIVKKIPRYGYQTYVDKVYNSDDCFSVDTEMCTNCAQCVKSCPVNNIRFDKKVLWLSKHCQLCLACYHSCSVNAIQYSNGGLTTIGKRQYWNY